MLFTPYANAENITISRGKEFKLALSPAEINKATSVLGTALSLESFEELPSNIANAPFVVRFFEDGQLALERSDASGSVPFRWNETDELILTLEKALAMAVNERTLIKGARGTGASTFNSEPFI